MFRLNVHSKTIRLNFAKPVSFYSTHSSQCSRFFNVAFTFTIVFNLFYLLKKDSRVSQYFEL